jgi:hypothetical protein
MSARTFLGSPLNVADQGAYEPDRNAEVGCGTDN